MHSKCVVPVIKTIEIAPTNDTQSPLQLQKKLSKFSKKYFSKNQNKNETIQMAPNHRKPRSYYHRSQLKLNTAHTSQSHSAIHTTTYAQRSRERKNSDVLFTVTSFVSDFDCLRSLSLLGAFCLVHPFSMCSVSLFTRVF